MSTFYYADATATAWAGGFMFKEDITDQNNFNEYRMIRNIGMPGMIDVHFAWNDIDPTGMGEPTYPPTFGALANALFKATGKEFTINLSYQHSSKKV